MIHSFIHPSILQELLTGDISTEYNKWAFKGILVEINCKKHLENIWRILNPDWLFADIKEF